MVVVTAEGRFYLISASQSLALAQYLLGLMFINKINVITKIF